MKDNERIISDGKDYWKCKRIHDPTLYEWEEGELLCADGDYWQKLEKVNVSNPKFQNND